jgi:UDPglucose 6-dehydrogenase
VDKIGVIGLGVGYALACCLAEAGYETVGIDTNCEVVAKPRIDASVKRLLKYDGRHRKNIRTKLELSIDYGKLSDRDYVMVCVSTGDERKLMIGHVEKAVDSCCHVMKHGATIVVYSTLPFGGSKKIKQVIERNHLECDNNIQYVHMPLMIAQGTTADDFVNPPFVAFGSYSPVSAHGAVRFYRRFITSSSLWQNRPPPMYITQPETAELAKLTANAFLSTKMSFANMTDMLCKKVGVDSAELLNIVGSDWRIGRKMLKPGFAWGGNCFPRDTQSLVNTYGENKVNPAILKATLEINDTRLLEPYSILLGRKIDRGPVLVLGLAYKSGVNIISGSKGVQLLKYLQQKGYDAIGYDPNVNPKDERDILEKAYRAVIITTDNLSYDGIVDKAKDRNAGLLVLDYRMPKTHPLGSNR